MKSLRILICLLWASLGQACETQSYEIRRGNEYYKKGRYIDAQRHYEKALRQNESVTEANYNLGNVYFLRQRYTEAIARYQKGLLEVQSTAQKSAIYYNLGCAFFQNGQAQEALTAFKNALIHNPKDEAARYNYEFTRNFLNQELNKKRSSQHTPAAHSNGQEDFFQEETDSASSESQSPSEAIGAFQRPLYISKEDAEKLLDNLERVEKKTQSALPKSKKPIKEDARNLKDW